MKQDTEDESNTKAASSCRLNVHDAAQVPDASCSMNYEHSKALNRLHRELPTHLDAGKQPHLLTTTVLPHFRYLSPEFDYLTAKMLNFQRKTDSEIVFHFMLDFAGAFVTSSATKALFISQRWGLWLQTCSGMIPTASSWKRIPHLVDHSSAAATPSLEFFITTGDSNSPSRVLLDGIVFSRAPNRTSRMDSQLFTFPHE